MNTNDKGLHDPVRTLEEAKVDMGKPFQMFRDEVARQRSTFTTHRSLMEAIFRHIDAQAEEIDALKSVRTMLESDLVSALRDLED